MTHSTCRLTAKNRDQLRNPTLGNRVWATFTFYQCTTLLSQIHKQQQQQHTPVQHLDLSVFELL